MISLQQIREKDLILIAQWEKNQFIKNYMNVKPIMTLKDRLEWLEKIRNNKRCRYWIINNYGIKIGMLKLNDIDIENKSCSIEYYIGDLHFRKRKITPILIWNVYEYVFEHMNFDKIWCSIKINNKYAMHINEKMGFERGFISMISNHREGEVQDNIYLSIGKEKWNDMKSKYKFKNIIIE